MIERPKGAAGRWLALAIPVIVLFAAASCDTLDRLLAVEAPGVVIADDLDDPAHAGLLVEGAIADFDCAFTHYTVAGGLVGFELMDSQATAAQWAFDRRSFAPTGGWYATSSCSSRLGVYEPLSTARWAADHALEKLDEWGEGQVPNWAELVAKAAAYSGYSHVLLGEGFCSAAVDLGPELGREQLWELAEDRFGRAIEVSTAAGLDELRDMALVGRARARLNLGRMSEAAADASEVPEGFVRHASYSSASGRSANRVYRMNIRDRQISVYPRFWGLEYDGVPDPRVEVVQTGEIGPNGQTEMAEQRKFLSDDDPMPLARWEEAQLIIAEAEGGQSAVEAINRLRDQVGLPHFESTDPDEIQAQIIDERQRELFLESHHLGDINRYRLDLDPAPGEDFVMGGVYQDQRCFPLPDVERENNPNID